MSGIFSSFNTANKGLIAQQTALQTVSHNISNANTEGFSRQRVELKADLSYNYVGVGQIGTGVKMESVERLVDDYVSKQIRQENSTLQRFASKADIMAQLEIIFNEPSDTGLNFNLGEMFNSWQELSKNPESLNSKTIVVENAKSFADTLNHMANQIGSLESETLDQIDKNVKDFNSIVDQLKSLNQQIFNIAIKGHPPNDLLDQRDLMLKNLSSISNIDTSFDQYGRVDIKIGETDILVDTVQTEIDAGSLPADIRSGKLKGNTEALGEIEAQKTGLDQFAKTMAEAINTVHRSDTGVDFFTSTNLADPISADTIQVNQDILEDNSKVNAGKSSGSPEGDGSRALAIARLRNAKISFSDNPDFASQYDEATMTWTDKAGGVTIEGAYSDIVTKVGISKEHADNMVANQDVLLGQLENRRESTSGVFIDEEITNLIKFQKSYEANAKVISVLTEMLDTLINGMGV